MKHREDDGGILKVDMTEGESKGDDRPQLLVVGVGINLI